MATHLVNLDALIPREDFESSPESVAAQDYEPTFKLNELLRGNMYLSMLRKPDFQRETANWKPEMIVDFIECFLDDKLIPSIIIWFSTVNGKIFVIDGAHRISALIAWVNDDYGDGAISQAFFGPAIPAAQKKLHLKTKELVQQRIGTYADLAYAGLHADLFPKNDPKVVRGRKAAARPAPIQKVIGNAAVAEESFFKINGNPATIDRTELDLLRARKKPNAIATRALIRGGTGHKYWNFPEPHVGPKIESVAKATHDLIFGQIHEIGSQSADVPRAGQPYSAEAFKLVLDMVNIFNEVPKSAWQASASKGKGKRKGTILEDDTDGQATLSYLTKVQDIGKMVFSNDHTSSLGLDPAVYSYSSTGSLHHAAFIASFKLAQELNNQDKLFEFTNVRKDFEDFLVAHKSFLNDLGHAKGSGTRSLEAILQMYRIIMRCLWNGVSSHDAIIAELHKEASLASLETPSSQIEDETTDENGQPIKPRKKFPKSAVAAGVLRELPANRGRCSECGARLPPNARTKDHVVRQEDGGMGVVGNLAFTHPYCNTGYKEKKNSASKKSVNQN